MTNDDLWNIPGHHPRFTGKPTAAPARTGGKLRLRALILLLRYSGLRIRDAVTLSRNRIQGDKLFLYTRQNGHCGLLSASSVCRSSQRDSRERLLLLDWIIKTEERSGGLAAKFEAAPHFGRRARRPCTSFPRYVFRRTFACGSADRTRVNSLGSPECADHREALCAVGSGTSGAARS